MPSTKSNVLPKDKHGNASQEILHRSVGRALFNWEYMQISLARLFLEVSLSGDNKAVHRAFGYQMVVTAKLDMIEHAAKVSLGKHALFEKTHTLLNLIRGFNERRNDIAHGLVAMWDVEGQSSPDHFYLLPTWTTTKKVKEDDDIAIPDYCWNADQIDRYAVAFLELREEVLSLGNEVRQHFS